MHNTYLCPPDSGTGYSTHGPPFPQQVSASQLGDPGSTLSGHSGPQVSASQLGDPQAALSGQTSRPQRPSLWKWVSMKEVVFVFLACSIAAVLFRVRDTAKFHLSWEVKLDPLLYRNEKFPMNNEKL